MVGKTGRVTSPITKETLGEVVLPIRGGSEAFMAQSDDPEPIVKNARVVVLEYFPPRTVVVTKCS